MKRSRLRIAVPGDRLGIKVWLYQHDRNIKWLADQVGVSANYVTMILSGQRTPSLDVAARLEDITGIPARKFRASA
jgi:antitoxin component HigA of HigAB toxin-antitoxin module